MKIDRRLGCEGFPCIDVRHACYAVPPVHSRHYDISIVLISEAAPADPGDYYYAKGSPLFLRTTLQAFNDAGAKVSSLQDILGLGVYLTTAVKCAKIGYGLKAAAIKECSSILRKEIALFPNVKAFLLMGDVAMKAINCIAHEAGEERVIPAGSTYKIRGQRYFFQGKRVFPSYLQAGPSFFIEKSKRKMIADDIAAALSLAK
jgi:uracil-DNA glycosylase